LNPRRPTPSGPKPDLGATAPQPPAPPSNHSSNGVLKQALGIQLSQKLLDEFQRWCEAHSSAETCRQYSRKLAEIDRGERGIESSRWHITAYKRLARFLCEEKGNERACEEFKRVRSRRSGADLYVPQTRGFSRP
jgi:intergrase/recombinase